MDNCILNMPEAFELFLHSCRSEFCRLIGASGVIVHAQAVRHDGRCGIQQATRPADVVARGTRGDKKWLGAAHLMQIAGKLAIEATIVIRPHTAAATPTLIAHAPILHAEWIGGTIGCALVAELAAAGIIAIFDPVTHFRGRPGADITGQIRLCSDQPTEPDELMRAKAIVLDVVAPTDVHALGTLFPWPNAFAPVIVVSIATARPAQYWHAQRLQILNGALAIAMDIRDGRILAHPQSTIDTGTQVLGKLAMQKRTHNALFLLRANEKLLFAFGCSPQPARHGYHRRCHAGRC